MNVWWERRKGLRRFKTAQDRCWDEIERDLYSGEKTAHWMWFTFPQAKGLGRSDNARIYALSHREARAYYVDVVLRNRLLRWTQCVVWWMEQGRGPELIFGDVDALKFRSCMELFSEVTGERLFERARWLTIAHDTMNWAGREEREVR
jgi:uncharacterized protein (DUF1810 family)